MHSPFIDFPTGAENSDEALVSAARTGDLAALDALLTRHRPWVFNLALRMVWQREMAEDATQEILVKVVRRLDSFQGSSKFSTWLYRVAVNHLLNVRKSEMETKRMTLRDMGRSLDECEDADLPDPSTLPVETGLLVEEAKIGCVTAMLMCLDRRQRAAFILGEIFGVSSEAGAELMEISPENFRQLLSRARRDLYAFMNEKCGLVNTANPCRCSKKTKSFMKNGWLDRERRQFSVSRLAAVREVAPSRLDELTELERAHARIHRDAPFSDAPSVQERLSRLLAASNFSED